MTPEQREVYEQRIRSGITIQEDVFKPSRDGKLSDYDLDVWGQYFDCWALLLKPEAREAADGVLLEALSKMSLIEIADWIKRMHSQAFNFAFPEGVDPG